MNDNELGVDGSRIKSGRSVFNPSSFYFMVLISLLYGYIRVKRERKAFQTRIEDVYDELKFTYSKGWVPGICLSIISVGLGISLPPGFIVLIAVMTIVFSLFFKASALSSAYTLGFSFIAAFGLMSVQVSHSWYAHDFQ